MGDVSYLTQRLTELGGTVPPLNGLTAEQVYNLEFVVDEADLPVDVKIQYILKVLAGTADALQDNPLLADQRAEHERVFTIQTTDSEIQESQLLICPRCTSRKAKIVATPFNRSGDEQQAIQCACYQCGLKWYLQR